MRELGTARASGACRVCRGTCRRGGTLGELGKLALRGEGDNALEAVPPLGDRQGLGDLGAGSGVWTPVDAGRSASSRSAELGAVPPRGLRPGWHRQGPWQALGRVGAAGACGRSGTAERAERWGALGASVAEDPRGPSGRGRGSGRYG